MQVRKEVLLKGAPTRPLLHGRRASSPEKRRLVSPIMGDSSPSEVATHLPNVNVREVASYLCQIFGETSQQQGYYIQLAHQHNNPQAWLGALLETLFAQQRGSVRNPGGYFYKRCAALHKATPTETIQLVERSGAYTYAKQNA